MESALKVFSFEANGDTKVTLIHRASGGLTGHFVQKGLFNNFTPFSRNFERLGV